jgi:hypothetical protein
MALMDTAVITVTAVEIITMTRARPIPACPVTQDKRRNNITPKIFKTHRIYSNKKSIGKRFDRSTQHTRTPIIHPNLTMSTFGFISTCDGGSRFATARLTSSPCKSMVDPSRSRLVSCKASNVGRLFGSGDVMENKFR